MALGTRPLNFDSSKKLISPAAKGSPSFHRKIFNASNDQSVESFATFGQQASLQSLPHQLPNEDSNMSNDSKPRQAAVMFSPEQVSSKHTINNPGDIKTQRILPHILVLQPN